MNTPAPYKILFVCLGNICRSPLAETVFSNLVQASGLQDAFVIDSAGTGDWHLGELADYRSREIATTHGMEITHRARQVQVDDFYKFDLILGMDYENLHNLHRLAPADATAKVGMLRDFDPMGKGDVPDPYYGSFDGFERMYRTISRCSANLLTELTNRQGFSENSF